MLYPAELRDHEKWISKSNAKREQRACPRPQPSQTPFAAPDHALNALPKKQSFLATPSPRTRRWSAPSPFVVLGLDPGTRCLAARLEAVTGRPRRTGPTAILIGRAPLSGPIAIRASPYGTAISTQTSRWSDAGVSSVPNISASGSSLVGQKTPEPVTVNSLEGST